MVNGIESLLISNIGAVTVAGGFIWYLSKKAEIDRKIQSDFNNTLKNHLKHSNKVIKDNSDVQTKTGIILQELSGYIKSLNGKK